MAKIANTYVLVNVRRKVPTIMRTVIGLSEQDLWNTVVRTDLYGSGHTRKTLEAKGWRAIVAELHLPERP